MTSNTRRAAGRLWTAGLLFQVGIAASFGAAPGGQGAPATGRPDDKRGRSTMGSDEEIETLDKTVVRVGEAEVAITLADAKAMRDALLEYLKQSDYEDRDALIRWTQGPARIDHEGIVRIGPWVLGAGPADLFLRYREPPGRMAGKAHKATVARKDEAWTVTKLEMERIRVR